MRPIPPFLAAALIVLTVGASAQERRPNPAPSGPALDERAWAEEKCRRYRADWQEALRRFGTVGLGRSFIDRHEAFVAGGCTGEHDVCPRSEREIALANILTIRAMNAGMASTFVPFACRD